MVSRLLLLLSELADLIFDQRRDRESRVEGPGPHVFVYDKVGNRYRVQVPKGDCCLANERLSAAAHPHW